jgi:gamma-glutamyltranspeptidase/glutathione hydrolase
MVEAMRHAFLDRNTLLGDPAFVANPIDTLLSPDHAARIRAAITDRAGVSEGLSHDPERPQTTQFTIVDHAGNAAAVTYTINGGFGAATIAGRTGFLLNNEMDDFTTKPGTGNMYGLVQGEANAIAPGKRPLSSMTPLLVMRDGRLLLAGGSPGGSRIITIMLQVIMNVLDYGMSLQEAVDAGRIHHQWLPDTVYAEPFALSPDTQQILRTMGYTLREQRHWGAAEMIQIGPATPPNAPIAMPPSDAALSGGTQPGLLYGANDSRRPAGAAIGP